MPWKLDRFARNVADHFNVKAMLMKYGVRIMSVTEPIDTKPEGKLMETILAGFAQFDNDIRAMRTVQGMRRRIQEGICPWKTPLGYKSSAESREKKNRPHQPDEPLFGLLRKAWREFATGAHTKAEIRRLMERWGITNRKGQPLSFQYIDKFFRNPFYAGIIVDPWSGEEHQGLHVPLISRQEFAAVQRVIARRGSGTSHRKQRAEFPMRGLVRCPLCLRYLTGSSAKGRSRRYPYYHCYSMACSARGKGLPVAKIHGEFTDFLSKIAPKTQLLEKLAETIRRSAEEEEALHRSHRLRSGATLDRLNKEMKELIRIRTQDLINDAEFQLHRSLILERRNAVEATSAVESSSWNEVRDRLHEIIKPLHDLTMTWKALPGVGRSRFQRLILPTGFIPGRIGTAELGLLFTTIENFSRSDSTSVTLSFKHWNHICQDIKDFSDVLRGEESPEDGSENVFRTELTI